MSLTTSDLRATGASAISSADPGQSTSSPAQNSTVPAWPGRVPGQPAVFDVGEDGAYYTNTTIDDFSPLITFSNLDNDWVSPLTDSDMSATRPVVQRTWQLGTYRRTEAKNATVKIEFWGSEIQLYGDTGPAYGAYTLTLDDETPTLHTAFYPALAVGPSHLMHTLSNLSEGRHELTITNLGTREGLIEGPSFLLDFALVRQKVGDSGRLQPQTFDFRGANLTSLTTNGTWSSGPLQDDLQPGEGGIKPAIYIERPAFWTTENWATLTHNFRGTGVQVYGGRNATHGAYRATLTATNSSTVVTSGIYNATAPCDFPEPEAENVKPGCEWKGSSLKFAVANLDPDIEYQLTLQNIHQGERSVFEVDLIRIINLQGNGNGTTGSNSSNGSSGELNDDDTGGARLAGLDPLTHLLVLVMTFLTVWRALKH